MLCKVGYEGFHSKGNVEDSMVRCMKEVPQHGGVGWCVMTKIQRVGSTVEVQRRILENIISLIDPTFRSIIKSSLLTFWCRLSTIVQHGKPPACVDSGTNVDLSSLQNMQTRLKF